MKLFSVVPNQGSYRATRHQFKLIFQFRTTVRDAICDFIPKSALTISPFTELLETKEDSDFLVVMLCYLLLLFVWNDCNVVGLLVSVSEEKEYDKDGKKMKMAVMELAENDHVSNSVGRVGLQNVMFASKLGFNLDIPEVAAFQKSSIPYGAGTFVVLAKIAEIVEDGIWWYSSCVCGRGVQAESRIYFCQFCNIHVINVTPRFRVNVLVEDSTGVSIFVLFDREASFLLNKTCAQLFEQHVKDVDVVFGTQSPPIFQEIVGKTMLFKVLCRPVGMDKFKGTYPVRRVCDDAAIVGMSELSSSDLSPEKAEFVPKGEGSFGEPSKVTKSPNLGLTPSSFSKLFVGSPQCTQKESTVVDMGTDEDAKCPLLNRMSIDAVMDKLNEVDNSKNSCDEVDESEEEYVVGLNRGSLDAEKDVKPSLKRLRRSLRLQFDEADESRGSGNDGSSGQGVN
ncbi:Replication factor-A carboxy-terminal domain protein [Arachis hypogaea]|nr:Replication factor-A carboxy-terminal domain protein [Arachis hypogaea]